MIPRPILHELGFLVALKRLANELGEVEQSSGSILLGHAPRHPHPENPPCSR